MKRCLTMQGWERKVERKTRPSAPCLIRVEVEGKEEGREKRDWEGEEVEEVEEVDADAGDEADEDSAPSPLV